MLTQYIYSTKAGLLRIVEHGRGWRTLLEDCEMGRHASTESALGALRSWWPNARIPASLSQWRCLRGSSWVRSMASESRCGRFSVGQRSNVARAL